MISADYGATAPLQLQLVDGSAAKGVQAVVKNVAGATLGVVTLAHTVSGLYVGQYTFGAIGFFHVQFLIYTDGTLATQDLAYEITSELYRVMPTLASTNPDLASIVQEIADAVWNEEHAEHLGAASTGLSLFQILNAAQETSAALPTLAKTAYVNRHSTTFNSLTSEQELIVWAERDGARVTATSSCIVTVKNDLGVTIWGASMTSPNPDGVYRFYNPVSIGVDKNFYVIISIVVDGTPRVNQQPFFTIG